jgi:hypothetical protein
MDIILPGGAIIGVFEGFGIIKYIRENNIKINKVYCFSSGCIIGVCLLLNIDLKKFIKYTEKIVDDPKKLSPTEMCMLLFKYQLDQRANAHELLSGRLYIGVTTPSGFRFISNFKSKDYLIDSLMGSTCLPVLFSWKYKSQMLDGGITYSNSFVPKNAIAFPTTVKLPFNTIIPPEWLRKLFLKIGYSNAKYNINIKNNNIYHNTEYLCKLAPFMFFIQEYIPNKKSLKDFYFL